MIYKQRIVAAVFLILIMSVALRCLINVKKFYWGIEWHLNHVNILYESNYLAAIRGGIESTVQDEIPWNKEWMELYGAIQYYLDKNYIKGTLAAEGTDIIRLKNHYLTFEDKDASFPEIAARVIRFNDYLSQKGIHFLYVQAPGKVCKTDPQLPRGVVDPTNQKADAFVKELKDAGVVTLDLRDEFPLGGPDYYSLFFVGDHHWNPLGGSQGARRTAAFINDHFDVKLDADVLIQEKFSREGFQFRYTGTQRNRIGNFYTLPDNNILLLPLFPTQFTVVHDGQKTEGEFERIWVNKSSLADDESCYGLYINRYGNQAIFINHNTHSTARILLVGDSFKGVFSPFMSLSCKEYMGVTTDCGYSIKEVVEAYQPDLVIFLYYPNLRRDILDIDYGGSNDQGGH